jgi:hypothetical protein
MTTEGFVDALFGSLILRKAYHVIGGFIIIALLVWVSRIWLFALGFTYLLAFWIWGRRISFAVLAILILITVTGSRLAATGAAIVFTIGDGIAAIIGARYGKTTWPWHRKKTMLGTFSFFVGSFLALAMYVHVVAQSSGVEQLLLALLPSLMGAVVECLPVTAIRDRKPDDNLLVILTSGLVFHILERLFAIGAPA